jgi:preprotein translocase subunit YajC
MNAIVLAQSGTGSYGVSQLPLLFVIVATFAIFYFILIRPQQKKQKDLQKMIDALRKGDRVMTTGGIFGSVVGMKENIIVLKIAEDVKIEILKNAVASVISKEGSAS